MGRVRRYKKFKAVDPFAKGHRTETDLVHDEPPDLHDERGKKKRRRYEDMDEDMVMRREGHRVLREEKEKQAKISEHKVEGKSESETMKEFKTRIRNETRKVLHDELKGMTATAQKRKLRLKERKIKRKTKGKTSGEDVPDFYMAENGHIRPSDMGGPDDFSKIEKVSFGVTGERPPDLSGFSVVKPKAQDMVHPLYSAPQNSAKSAGAKFMERQKLREDRDQFMAKEKEAVVARPASAARSLSLKELVQAQESAKQAYAALRQKRMQGK